MKKNVKKLVADSKIKEAIELALDTFPTYEQEVLLLKSRYIKNEKDQGQGMISWTDYIVELNKIRKVLLNITEGKSLKWIDFIQIKLLTGTDRKRVFEISNGQRIHELVFKVNFLFEIIKFDDCIIRRKLNLLSYNSSKIKFKCHLNEQLIKSRLEVDYYMDTSKIKYLKLFFNDLKNPCYEY